MFLNSHLPPCMNFSIHPFCFLNFLLWIFIKGRFILAHGSRDFVLISWCRCCEACGSGETWQKAVIEEGWPPQHCQEVERYRNKLSIWFLLNSQLGVNFRSLLYFYIAIYVILGPMYFFPKSKTKYFWISPVLHSTVGTLLPRKILSLQPCVWFPFQIFGDEGMMSVSNFDSSVIHQIVFYWTYWIHQIEFYWME